MKKQRKSVKKSVQQNQAPVTNVKKPGFVRRMFKFIWRKKWWILIIAVIGGGVWLWYGNKQDNKLEYTTINITRGDLRQVVSATGEIQPVNTVSVGSQVSGTIDNLYVDFNSKVKKGDVLLTIEPSVLQASVDEAKASLVSAESQRNFAKSEYERDKMLFNGDMISRAELEQSQAAYEQSEQSVKRMQSQYERAVTNLGYATIISPVNGTVISRKVDVGQLWRHHSKHQTCSKLPKI